jgi:hypothetical protein
MPDERRRVSRLPSRARPCGVFGGGAGAIATPGFAAPDPLRIAVLTFVLGRFRASKSGPVGVRARVEP